MNFFKPFGIMFFFYDSRVEFLVLQQKSVQSTILFLFRIVDKILQTSSVTENSADAALQEDMAVSDML